MVPGKYVALWLQKSCSAGKDKGISQRFGIIPLLIVLKGYIIKVNFFL